MSIEARYDTMQLELLVQYATLRWCYNALTERLHSNAFVKEDDYTMKKALAKNDSPSTPSPEHPWGKK